MNTDQEIVKQYRGLLRDCQKRLSLPELKMIREALDLAIHSNAEEKEPICGLPFALHGVLVARIVAREIGLTKDAIVSALLYHAHETSGLPAAQLEKKFGKNVISILGSLSRLNDLNTSKTALQADSFHKLVLTLAGDIKVLLIKIAERLLIMRNLDQASAKLQVDISTETSYLYAALAHRLGLHNIKSELEDLSFKYMEPAIYHSIEQKLKETTSSRNRFIREFSRPIKEKLEELQINYEIKGRLKSIHSIWNKMKNQRVPFEEVYDLFAIRIILESDPEYERALCWQAYSVVTDLYIPNPERLRDWISIPKSNGYESLHTTVAHPKGRWVEVQIRTVRMNEIAEKGLAAHWKYKGGKSDRLIDEWLQNMREILESTGQESPEFVDQVKLNLFSDEIFVFTPRGDLKRLPKGATVLDFAFEVHSEVGAHCTGGKVNQKNVSIKHPLKNGDLVEIITSRNQKPKIDWLNSVVTSKAKSKIRQSLNEEKAKEAEIGKEILKRRLRNWKIQFSDANVKNLLKHYNLKYALDLYFLISQEKIFLSAIKEFLSNDKHKELKLPKEENHPVTESPLAKTATPDDALIIANKVEKVDYTMAKCCHPILGDKIFGFVTIHSGIKIHRMDCPNARQLFEKYPYRVIQTKWVGNSGHAYFDAMLKISGIDHIGLVNRITEKITKELNVTMQSVNFQTKEGIFDGEVRVKVFSREHLEVLIRKIKRIKGVTKVTRRTTVS